jgi:hypothetical protein
MNRVTQSLLQAKEMTMTMMATMAMMRLPVVYPTMICWESMTRLYGEFL